MSFSRWDDKGCVYALNKLSKVFLFETIPRKVLLTKLLVYLDQILPNTVERQDFEYAFTKQNRLFKHISVLHQIRKEIIKKDVIHTIHF